MKDIFHGKTSLFQETLIATGNKNDIWIMVQHSDTDEKSVIDLDKKTAIDLANWILKEEAECYVDDELQYLIIKAFNKFDAHSRLLNKFITTNRKLEIIQISAVDQIKE